MIYNHNYEQWFKEKKIYFDLFDDPQGAVQEAYYQGMQSAIKMMEKHVNFKPSNMFPPCFKHVGGDAFCSNDCLVKTTQGEFKILLYMEEEGQQNGKWNCQGNDSVDFWLEL